MRIVLFNREWLFLRQFLVPRVRTNVKIARYMISAKDDGRCFVHGLKPTILKIGGKINFCRSYAVTDASRIPRIM